MERCVDIPVSKRLRKKIKEQKQSQTYEEFLSKLITKRENAPKPDRKGGSGSFL